MESSFAKGIQVLGVLARNGGLMRLATIAAEVDLPKSGVHRLLGSLLQLGFVWQDEDSGSYGATLKIWEWGQSVIAAHPVRRVVAPYMEELHRMTSETVNLTVLDGREIIFVEKILSSLPRRFSKQPGERGLAVLTASGRAQLAHREDAEQIVTETIALDPRAAHLKLGEVMRDLEDVRNVGFARYAGSSSRGTVSIAAALLDRDGRASAALGVSIPLDRAGPEQEPPLVAALLHTCARIGETIGPI